MRPHEILGVRPGANRREVTEAFRRFALQHHPDRGGDPARFQAGVDAYRQLTGSRAPTVSRADPHGRDPNGVDIVFHRRARPGLSSLLRVAGRRLGTVRFHP